MTDESPSKGAADADSDADGTVNGSASTDGSATTDDTATSDTLEDRTGLLARHLEATAELPIDREANRWLGEAEAVARDVATSDLDDETVRERVATVRELLAEIDETGHDVGDERLEAAGDVCQEILEDER